MPPLPRRPDPPPPPPRFPTKAQARRRTDEGVELVRDPHVQVPVPHAQGPAPPRPPVMAPAAAAPAAGKSLVCVWSAGRQHGRLQRRTAARLLRGNAVKMVNREAELGPRPTVLSATFLRSNGRERSRFLPRF